MEPQSLLKIQPTICVILETPRNLPFQLDVYSVATLSQLKFELLVISFSTE